MKRLLLFLAVIVGAVTAAWFTAQFQASHRRQAEEVKAHRFDPAPGRIESISLAAIFREPTKHNGKRLLLAGIWSTGFECSFLDRGENDTENFGIWVDVDWDRVSEPMGDLSRMKENTDEKSGVIENAPVRIVAEGTFFYSEKAGFGHLGGSKGLFLIDRLYRYETTNGKDPKEKPSEPTPIAGRL